jgi:hypothetical protein
MTPVRILVAAALAAAFTAPALAQSPVGKWAFETAPVNMNCQLSGEMTVWAKPQKNSYGCRFVAVQSCAGEPPLRFEVAQTCTAARTGADIAITSQIDRVISASPADFLDAVKAGYAPDHFEVTLNRTASEMNGVFHSLSEAAVRFWRVEDLIG